MKSENPPSVLKPLRHPRAWSALWALAIAIVIVLSLGPPLSMPEAPKNADKLQHASGYFLLAASAVQLFATRRALAVAGLGLVLLGIGLEWAQGAFTADRMADPLDALANTVGVLAGLALALTPLRDLLLRIERGLTFRRH